MLMKIQILISKNSWANNHKNYLKINLKKFSKDIKFLDNHKYLNRKYDVNIIFSYFQKIPKKYLKRSTRNIIPHESDLPKGKGMSPLTWQILENKKEIFFSLIEAGEKIDAGLIYYKKKIKIKKNLIFPEIKKIQLVENVKLIKKFLEHYKDTNHFAHAKKQIGKPTFYKIRKPKDSQLNINDTIKNQFNLLRVADPKNYPTFIKIFGKKFKISISYL